jgi:hypothetical protein
VTSGVCVATGSDAVPGVVPGPAPSYRPPPPPPPVIGAPPPAPPADTARPWVPADHPDRPPRGQATINEGVHCDYTTWTQKVQRAVPNPYVFSSASSDTSTDGANNFLARFGAQWTDYIFHQCVVGNQGEHQVECEHGNTGGNTIYDGGSDMYDIGNVIVSNLMDSPVSPGTSVQPDGTLPSVADCWLGSIVYETDFSPIATTCFGPGGYYQMTELDGLWVFFTRNYQEADALAFGVLGNLGADGSGAVSAFEFSSGLWAGFVKSTCGADADDAGVNHLMVVDSGSSSRYVPFQRCRRAGAATDPCSADNDFTSTGECQGSCSNFDVSIQPFPTYPLRSDQTD